MESNESGNQQNQYYQTYPQYIQVPPPMVPNTSNGLGVAALVMGIIAIIGSWIPLLNVISIIFAIVALGLGIPGLIVGIVKKRSKGPSIAGLVLGVLSLIIFIASYAVVINAIDRLIS